MIKISKNWIFQVNFTFDVDYVTYIHTVAVARLESFRALKLSRLESFRVLKSHHQIGEF